MKNEREWRSEVLRRMARLTEKKANDAVKLAFVEESDWDKLDEMDLSCLTEMKRHSNGAVEIKLVDRVEALEKLFEMAGKSGDGAERFLKALEQSTQREKSGEEG